MSQKSSDYFHDRAAKSSFEARGRAMNFSAAGIAGLFVLITAHGFSADHLQKALIILSGCFLALCIGSGVFNSFADAQWSYQRAVLLDPDRIDGSEKLERAWHRRKEVSEKLTQITLVAGVILAASILILRVLSAPNG